MRTWSLLLVGAAALAGSSGAIAAPISGSAIKAAAEQIGVGESVHCRPFRHWHRWGYGRGCQGATIYYDTGPRHRYGYRYGHRDGYGRGGVDVRTRSGTTFRSEQRTIRSGGDFRGGATIRGGGQAGDVGPRGPAGGQLRGGGQAGGGAVTGGGGGGQMRSAPTGGGGPAAGGPGGGGQGGGRGQGGGQNKQ